jgi:rhodanese-related sulfurtransferase
MPPYRVTSPAAVRRLLAAGREVALLDVRTERRFAQGHPLFAASFPRGQLEAQASERLPRRDVPLVLYGDGADAEAAAARLGQLGYADVSLLAGGLAGWTAAGGELFTDVNAPSKAFGELVAETAGTPLLPAESVAALLRGDPGEPGSPGARVVVVDARRFDEYSTMSIPTATSVPGAELVARVGRLAPDPATTVIVNCAGRTRSIIGAQSLINAGLPNRVAALRNGTIGWTLAGLRLEHGQARRAPEVPPESSGPAAAAAWRVAERAGVTRAPSGGWPGPAGDGGARTVYRFDVRSPEEHAAGQQPGFRSAPGGQLVQETDWYAPVRGALIVLAGDRLGRAAMTGSWLAQMGWQVVVADPVGEVTGEVAREPWRPWRPPAPAGPRTTPAELARWLADGQAVAVDLETSKRYAAGHIPGAAWARRADLAGRARSGQRMVLTSADGYLAQWAAADLAGLNPVTVSALDGGTQGWERSGRPLEPGGELLSPADDVYRRPYEGTGVDPAVMQAYLDWEYGLTGQLERDGTHGFRVLLP